MEQSGGEERPARLLIHDREIPFAGEGEYGAVVRPGSPIHPCTGCFGCWVRTPGQCVIWDAYGDMGACIAQCDELVLVSRCCYGGPSPFVKNVLDRSIGYIHPCFVIKGGEMHHRQRYPKTLILRSLFYGDGLTRGERQTAESWVRSLADNLYCEVRQVAFGESAAELEGLL